ncbi:cysteine synthase A [Riemerella columbina]|uniref:cysteine synthase A n=1 Tax=Riemerella columbina TaxID=103810 RepID=UPI000374A959|nr:cysteine synthase A [Riemerella columbina]
MKINNILESIGNTPEVKINHLFTNIEVWMKLERSNPGGSIKDRIALAMVEDAEASGKLKKGMTIIEPTSGNTGVGLAMVAAVKGYEITLVMPESMSVERRFLMQAYGAKFILTPKEKGMKGAIEKAQELVNENANYWMPQQFENPSNPEVHTRTTAIEIIKDFPEGLDYLITGVGTGGHISGVSKILKQHFPNLKTYAVEPETSPVLSGGEAGPHPIQGIGAGFVPKTYDASVIDGVITVSKEKAFEFARLLAQKEGVLGGISTGASLAAIDKIQSELPKGAKVLTFNYDTGERYGSVEGLY